MASGFSSLTQQIGFINTLTMFLPFVISLGAISGGTYWLLGKSKKVQQRENSKIIRIGISATLGFLLALPATQILMTSLLL